MWDYVRTDRTGHIRRDLEPFATRAPDDEIVRKTAESCRWDCDAAAAALKRLKRYGGVAKSYGYFPAVLPKLIAANWPNLAGEGNGRLQHPNHGRAEALDQPGSPCTDATAVEPTGAQAVGAYQFDAEFDRRRTGEARSSSEIIPELLRKYGCDVNGSGGNE
jgi:hypothetical protein